MLLILVLMVVIRMDVRIHLDAIRIHWTAVLVTAAVDESVFRTGPNIFEMLWAISSVRLG